MEHKMQLFSNYLFPNIRLYKQYVIEANEVKKQLQ